MIKAGLKHFIMDATINILAILTSAGICANKKPNGSIRILFIVLFFVVLFFLITILRMKIGK